MVPAFGSVRSKRSLKHCASCSDADSTEAALSGGSRMTGTAPQFEPLLSDTRAFGTFGPTREDGAADGEARADSRV